MLRKINNMGCCIEEQIQMNHITSLFPLDYEVHLPYADKIMINKSRIVGQTYRKCYGYSWKGDEKSLKIARNQFWQTRVAGKPEIWKTLEQMCKCDVKTGMLLAQAAELVLNNGSILGCYDKTGVMYDLVIFALNQPDQFISVETETRLIKQKQIKVVVRTSGKASDLSFDIVNTKSVEQLKRKVANELGVSDVRLCVLGRQMKDQRLVGQYKAEQAVIQAMIIKRSN